MRRLLVLLVVAGALWGAPGAFAAGWCGSGESADDRPDATTGAQIHAIWAVPADGADTFATGAPNATGKQRPTKILFRSTLS